MEVQIFQTNPRLRGLLLILIFTFAASGIALAVLAQIQAYHREQIYLATESALPVHRVSTSVPSPSNGEGQGEVDTKGWKTYRNEKYGFELAFSAPLLDFKAGGVYGDKMSFVPFSVLDDRGYVDLFAILIYPKTEWVRLSEEPRGIYINETANDVFSYQLFQDPPTGIPNLLEEVKKVVSTFKFTK